MTDATPPQCIAFDRHGTPCDKDSYIQARLCEDHALEVYVEMQGKVSANMGRLFKLMKEEARRHKQGPTEQEVMYKEAYEAQSVVYYVRISDYIKIGFTRNLNERLKQLRVYKEDLMATEPGGRDKERERHQQFADIRRGKRENFDKTPELLTHIARVRREHGAPKITTFIDFPKEDHRFTSARAMRLLT